MRNRRGFLLLEVIVSIVVVTAGLLFVMRAYSTSSQAINRSGRMFMQTNLLENQMFDIEEPGQAELGRKQGVVLSFQEYSWSSSAEPVEDSSLDKVTVDLSYGKAAQTSTESLVTLLWNKKAQ